MMMSGSLKARLRISLMLFAMLSLASSAPLPPAGAVQDERVVGSVPAPAPAGVAEEERTPGPLVVYGEDLMFSIMEPKGWTADIENAPKVSAGVILYRESETFEKHEVLIAIRVAKKVDERTEDDLAHEMAEFRNLYPDVQFKDLKVKHPAYKAHAKIFAIAKSRYDYVAFLNPGPVTPYLFSVTMYRGKKQAGKAELNIYKDIIRSLEFIPQDAAAPQR